MKIKAVIFDLDDTLYPEADYVKSGFGEVENTIEKKFGLKNIKGKLFEYFLLDKTDVYGRFLRNNGVVFTDSDIKELAESYRAHKPELKLLPEVKDMLLTLRANGCKTGIITDGRPLQQNAKIDALGLRGLVDEVIVTDELGGPNFRKPNPLAFDLMCKNLCVDPEEMVYVGDNPKKDFAVKKYLPVYTVYVRNCGLYKDAGFYDGITPDFIVNRITEILTLI